MLVLSRRPREDIVIRTPDGYEVVVGVVEIRDGKVRLGFAADVAVTIHRREVQDSIDREKIEHERRRG